MNLIRKIVKVCFLISFFSLAESKSQCINTYPNTENFESAPAWTCGGTNSDWTWGTPSKAVITGAGGGTKCWITGGLTGNFYKYSEQSYIVSPCYDFSSLTYPHVSFKIFWESENKYDGGNLQYSLNGGNTWTNVGAYGNPVDCMNSNWFNYSNVKYLNSPAWVLPNKGWCGNIQATSGTCQGGNGSGGWVTAQHCLNGLAGQPNVIFRFTFGAGTTCNSYDGLAIDDFTIENGTPNAPNFSYTCAGINSLSFTSINPPCPTPTSYQWNFGDPASGASNISSSANPVHVFTSPGTYTVTLTTSGGPCNPPGTFINTVTIMSANISSQTNVSCYGGNNGTASANVVNGNSPFTYSWSPSGGLSQTASGLSAGSYTVTVTDNNGCMQTATVAISQPPAIFISASSTPSACNGNSGTATVNVSGGTGNYSYLWNSNGQTSQTATGLAAGIYSVTVLDALGCTQTQTVAVASGNGPTVSVAALPANILIGNSSTITASGTGTYSWSDGEVGSSISVSPTANTVYCVTVTDTNGCTASSCVTVIVEPIDCSADNYFLPNAFSPNDDNENDEFKIYYGNISCIKEMKLEVFDRWGEKVFQTSDPLKGWDGYYKGEIENSAVYVYYLRIVLSNDRKIIKRGNVTILK